MYGTDVYLDIKFLTRVKFNRMLRLMVTCSHGMDILMYFVTSKGNIVDVGFFRPHKSTRYIFEVMVSKKLIPHSTIVFLTHANGGFKANKVDVKLYELGNPIKIKIEENISEDGVDPGDEIELSIRGRPGAFIALAAYDQRFLQYTNHRIYIQYSYHDIFLNNIWYMFNSFHSHKSMDYYVLGVTEAGYFKRTTTLFNKGKLNVLKEQRVSQY
ncbi:uncharacterized protein LOC125957731 [Anopheles darlingi]|uniref:uncharacterized protein LOC125957731 n=1 Tax=Anopheles darlingi TaxID=43151 RepID=UPI0021003CB2|nr:uncharacterized protein LOC125957731 [Anopheles darlingi]